MIWQKPAMPQSENGRSEIIISDSKQIQFVAILFTKNITDEYGQV